MPLLLPLLLSCQEPEKSLDSVPPEPPPWSAPDAVGPYTAGVETFTFVDGRGKELTMEVWYPALLGEGATPDPYPEIPITREAYRYAAPDPRGAPYPLVAFSHGFSGIRYQSIFLTEYLAQHGFVVVAPDHPKNTLLDLDETATGEVMMERPGDIRAAVDEVLRLSAEGHERLGGLVDPEGRYGMTGHSFGAITTLVQVGGELDGQSMVDYCASRGGWLCSLVDDVDPSLLTAEVEGDPRAVAPVAMSPGLWYAFGPDGEGLAPVEGTLMLGGTRDDLFVYDEHIHPTYERVSSPKVLGTLDGAGHYAFSDICQFAASFLPECEEDGYLDIAVAHEITQSLVTAWLGLHLTGDERYAPFLDADARAAWPALTWEEEIP